MLKLISFSLKNKEKEKSKNLYLVKFGVLGYKNTQKLFSIMFISDPQISSIRWGCMIKNNRNEINNVDAHRVWLCIHVTFSSIGKVFRLPAD